MGHHHSPSPLVPSRFGLVLTFCVAAFSVGLVGGFISGMRSERMEYEREAQRSKFAAERSGLQQRELSKRIGELELQLTASKDDAEKWRAMKTVNVVQPTGK